MGNMQLLPTPDSRLQTHASRLTILYLAYFMEIISATYIISSPSYDKCPKPNKPEYAFIGRSNVGKSSLINMLCNIHKLAKTSGSPGKTQLINHFEIVSDDKQHWYIVDLPGFGFAKVSASIRSQWEKMIQDYLRKRETLMNIFLLIDSRLSPQKLDIEFVNRLGKWKVPFALVFTKSDKNTQKDTARHVKDFLEKIKKDWEELPPYFVTSATKKNGRKAILDHIKELNQIAKNNPTK